MDNIVTTVGRHFPRQITHMTRNEWSLMRSRKVASRHRNLQLRRLDSLRSITSGFSVGLRGLSRLICLIPHYIIHADFKGIHAHTDRPAREPDAVSNMLKEGSVCLFYWGVGSCSIVCIHNRTTVN